MSCAEIGSILCEQYLIKSKIKLCKAYPYLNPHKQEVERCELRLKVLRNHLKVKKQDLKAKRALAKLTSKYHNLLKQLKK